MSHHHPRQEEEDGKVCYSKQEHSDGDGGGGKPFESVRSSIMMFFVSLGQYEGDGQVLFESAERCNKTRK